MVFSEENISIGKAIIPRRLFLAPMCGITHTAFRRMCKKYGAGLVTTQMVSAKAIVMRDAKSLKLLDYDESERPVAFQIFGSDADTLAEASRIVCGLGPDIVDLNMGCPARKVVGNGGGAALLRQPMLCARIFERMRSALEIPFTVKMRAGWGNGGFEEAMQIVRLAESSGVDAVTLHARTQSQGYSGKADWDLIRIFKQALSIPVIGNGDVATHEDTERMHSETGCDAVMVGRAAFYEPWFFRSCLEGKRFVACGREICRLVLDQYESFFGYFGLDGGIKRMRKHLCAYTRGFYGGSTFRNNIVTMTDWPAIKKSVEEFFT